MNNSDFISDAVALDLGKSGVKVAETLEIEVGNEWWRLINAADVMEGEVFSRRRLAEPIVEGDEIDLHGHLAMRELIYPYFYQDGNVTYQKSNAVGIAAGNVYYATLGQTYPASSGNYFGVGRRPVFEIKKEDGTVVNTYNDLSIETIYQFLIWDGVNNCFLGITRSAGIAGSMVGMYVDGTVIPPSTISGGVAASLIDVKTFLEKSQYIYSLFYQAGFFYIRETELTAGSVPSTLVKTVTTFSAAASVKLDAVQNSEGKGWLFYSRGFNSVGFMWRDSDDGAVKYSLQSEGFTTVRVFRDVTFGGTKWIEAVGNFVIPQEGEFIVVKTASLPTGVLTRPVGWTYPVNFTVLGSAETSKTKGLILGKVGFNFYRLEIDLENMAISKVWSVVLPIEIEKTVRLVYQKNGREIYVVCPTVESIHFKMYMVFCVDTVSESLVWDFYSPSTLASGDWRTTTLWVSTEPQTVYFGVVGNKAIFISQVSTTMHAYTVDVAALANCASKSDVYALLQASGRVSVTIPKNTRGYSMSAPTHTIEKDDSFLITAAYDRYSYNFWFPKPLVKVDSATGFPIGNLFTQWVRYALDVPYGYEAPNRTYTKLESMNDGDFVMVWYRNSWLAPVSGAPHNWVFYVMTDTGMQSCAPTGTRTFDNSDDLKRYPVALNDKQARLVFQGHNTLFATEGCAFSEALTTCAAYSDAVTLPFTYMFGLINQGSDRFFALSSVSDGDIKWARFNAREGLERKLYAVRPDDMTQIYTIKGLETSGGWVDMRCQGRFITGVTGVGRTVAVDLNAKDIEGYTGATPDEGEIGDSKYVYEYINRTFTPYPFAREGIRAELSNISKTTKITLPETRTNLIRGLLASGTDFRGSRCILRRIFPDHADTEGSDIVLLDGYIQDWSYVPGKKGIAFTVSKTLIDVGAQFPKRLMNMGCSHVFKGERCKYLGETGRCLKTKAFCQFLNNQNQFGGFPWVAARQRRVMWR